MQTQVGKWGNSLAVRIPRTYAEEAHLEEGTPVAFSVEDGRLIITPARAPRYSLAALLAGVTPENCHGETDWGPPVGREVW
jgi:antitoxin MazE